MIKNVWRRVQHVFQPVEVQRSLRWPLLRGLSGTLFLVLLLLWVVIFAFVADNEQKSWIKRQQEAARISTETIQTFIDSRQKELQLISLLESPSPYRTEQMLQYFLGINPSWLEIVRLDARAHVVASAAVDRPILSNIFTARQSVWFLNALSGKSYLGDVQISADNKPYLILAVPAVDGGVVVGRLRMDVLQQAVELARFGNTGIAYLVNAQNGQLIAHPNTELMMQGASLRAENGFEDQTNSSADPWLRTYRSLDGNDVKIYTSQVANTNWLVVVELQVSEVYSIRRWASVAFALGMVALWMAISWSTSRFLRVWVFDPLKKLNQGAAKIGDGDLSYSIPISNPDEIGQVAEAFNLMAASLSENQRRLLKARDQAALNARVKAELLANVSHELRTPLGVILGYAEMLHSGVYGEPLAEQVTPLEAIMESTRALNRMVSDLLDQAKLEANALRLRSDAFSPASLLRQVYVEMNVLAQQKQLALNTELDPDLPPVLYGDVDRLRQILINLVGNGLKFTRQGGVTIRLSCRDTNRWALQVIDTGTGIPAQARMAIFEPFHQLDNSPTREQGGTGLGLSIVQQLVAHMGGEILLNSQIGQGSTFTVVLPMQTAPQKESVHAPNA